MISAAMVIFRAAVLPAMLDAAVRQGAIAGTARVMEAGKPGFPAAARVADGTEMASFPLISCTVRALQEDRYCNPGCQLPSCARRLITTSGTEPVRYDPVALPARYVEDTGIPQRHFAARLFPDSTAQPEDSRRRQWFTPLEPPDSGKRKAIRAEIMIPRRFLSCPTYEYRFQGQNVTGKRESARRRPPLSKRTFGLDESAPEPGPARAKLARAWGAS